MATPPPPPQTKIRISQVAGRYLLFDLADVMRLRRSHSMCSVLVGTNPQAPNQNVFSGLPLELLPEEARLLVDRGDAYVADDPLAHLEALRGLSAEQRRAYVEAHQTYRATVRSGLEEEGAARSRAALEARKSGAFDRKKKKGKGGKKPTDLRTESSEESPVAPSAPKDTSDSAASSDPSPPAQAKPVDVTPSPRLAADKSANDVYVTLSTTGGIVGGSSEEAGSTGDLALQPKACPLYAHLNSKGYFMTPGIRFGGKYSVYPGDPFRFHAHFIANSYGWDQEIDLLDLVGTGRLAGAVKKGLLLGAEEPGEGAGKPDGENVRTFCVEWAGM